MWKFIITWCVITIVADPCNLRPYVDEFGISHDLCKELSMVKVHATYDCNHWRVFNHRLEAVSFYNEARKLTAGRDIQISRVRMDSVFTYPDGDLQLVLDTIYYDLLDTGKCLKWKTH